MNLRPPGYEPDELPSCSTPRHSVAFIGDIDYYTLFQQFCQEGAESFFAAEAEDENAAADLLSRKPAATPIHAPPREATKRKRLCTGHQPISIHAPPRGATIPRTERPDLELISIHAPPRGATNPWIILARRPNISIHAPPRGATHGVSARFQRLLFQFTPLREGRQNGFIKIHIFKYFNSRPSARGDRPFQLRHVLHADFNSRPSARGDATPFLDSRKRVNFNSRPSARGDRFVRRCIQRL